MKSFLLNAVLASVAFAAPAFAVAPEKCEETAPKYKNRLSVSPTSVSFERTAEDSWYAGFEYFEAPAFVAKNIDTTVSLTSFKLGQTFSIDCKSRIAPMIGVSMFRDESKGHIVAEVEKEGQPTVSAEYTLQNPFVFHGSVGFGAEYDLMKTTTVGLNVHGLMGGVWGSDVRKMSDMSWGMHAALPVTFRFGSEARWDARFEPFTLLLKDYANYVGGKAALGYRF